MPVLLTLYPRSALKVESTPGACHPLYKDSVEAEKRFANPLGFVPRVPFSRLTCSREYTDTYDDKRTGILSLHFANSNGIMGITDSTYVILPMRL
jgi:hypothetical protein